MFCGARNRAEQLAKTSDERSASESRMRAHAFVRVREHRSIVVDRSVVFVRDEIVRWCSCFRLRSWFVLLVLFVVGP